MQRDTKLGYGFLLAGATMPYLGEKFLTPLVSLIISATVFLAGIGFLIAAHHHDKPPIRRTTAMTIWLFTLYGAGIGALGGAMAGSLFHLRTKHPADEKHPSQGEARTLPPNASLAAPEDVSRSLRELKTALANQPQSEVIQVMPLSEPNFHPANRGPLIPASPDGDLSIKMHNGWGTDIEKITAKCDFFIAQRAADGRDKTSGSKDFSTQISATSS